MNSEFKDMEQMFADGLQNYEVTPPAHVWANIKKAKRKGFFYYFVNNKLKVASILLLLIMGGSATYYFSRLQKHDKTGKSKQTHRDNKTFSSKSFDSDKQGQSAITNDEEYSIDKSSTEQGSVSDNTVKTKNTPFSQPINSSSKSHKRVKTNKGVVKQNIQKTDKIEEPVVKDETSLSNALDQFVPISSIDRIKLKYLIYPSLMQYVYTSKRLFKKYYNPVIKDKNIDKPDYKFSIEVLGGYTYAFRTLSGGQSDLRDQSEKAGLSLHTGLKLNYHFNPTWSVQTGLIVENRNEKVNYKYSEIQTQLILSQHDVTVYHPVLPPRNTTIIDSTYQDQNMEVSFNTNNKYTSFNIPIVLSYNFMLGKLEYRISGGSLISVYTTNMAQNLAMEGNKIVLLPYKESSKIKASYYAAFGAQFPIPYRTDTKLFTELSYYHNVSNRLNKESGIKQKNYGMNVSVGLKVNLKH